MQVNTGIDLGFADGVRALMRRDPDIIHGRGDARS